MVRTWSVIRDGLVPLILFSSLVFGAKRFIFGHLYDSGLAKHLASACTSQATTTTHYRLSYVGHDKTDAFLCPIVTFFHAAIAFPDALSGLTYFVGIGGPLIAMPVVESWRAGRSIFIAYPVIFGLLSQTISIGMTFPIYWLIFILSGGANAGRGGGTGDAKITQAHAEAIVFGLVVGAIIPTVGMLVLEDPQVTAIWQLYPIYVSLAQYAHLALRPASKHSQPGYKTIRFLYLALFLISSSVHISTIWPLITNFNHIQRVFLPATMAPAHSTAVGLRVLHFLKWDLAFGLGAAILATLWFARNFTETIAMAAWNVIATPVFGPGAALAGAALWRESTLQATESPKIKET
ncbi:hypothetical protein D9615_001688 [Tricholomella constricta]|uniref:Uncharacterized protein n=1 Tax=Tricholomella constricta TaxID=117010 RepID=A0A8H5MAM1_9AGAR|nr:hypothetical protein D9615_001688 [Tricholomella constricta]